MRKATQVTATDNVNVILGYKESLCVLELFDVDFIVIVEVETGEIVASEEEDFVGGEGVDLEDLLADWEGDGLVVGVGDQLVRDSCVKDDAPWKIMLEEGMFETVLWSGYYESLKDQLGLSIVTDL
jgi:hypothetical protein